MNRHFLALRSAVLLLCVMAPSGVAHVARAQSAPATSATATSKTQSAAAAPEKVEETQDQSEQYRHSPMVQKLGSMIGMDPERASTLFTVTNLLILVIALGFLLAKTLPKAMSNRSAGIKKQLVDARTATEEAKTRLSSVEQRLSKLDEQIAAMKLQAESDIAREEQRIKAAAEEEKARILASAELEIQNATTMARREIQSFAAELAVNQASRKLVVSNDTDRQLVESFAANLSVPERSKN